MESRFRRFQGYAAIDRPDGALIWGTFRPTEAEAKAAYERHNPAVSDYKQTGQIVPVKITIEQII